MSGMDGAGSFLDLGQNGSQFVIGQVLYTDKGRIGLTHRKDQLVQLGVHSRRVTVLRVLDQEECLISHKT